MTNYLYFYLDYQCLSSVTHPPYVLETFTTIVDYKSAGLLFSSPGAQTYSRDETESNEPSLKLRKIRIKGKVFSSFTDSRVLTTVWCLPLTVGEVC